MNRTVAGIFDPEGTQSPERARAAALDALGGEARAGAAQFAGLSVAGEGMPRRVPLTGDVVAILAGNVYNAEPLAAELGLPFRDESGVVADAYRLLGSRAIARLRGDFTVVVWQPAARRGVIARDHLGSRGLYYTAGSRLSFASEVAPLLRLLPQRPAPDRVGVLSWLSSSFRTDDGTMFAGVRRLMPGHMIELEGGSWRIERYWQPVYREPAPQTRDEIAGQIRTRTRAAIGARSRAGERTAVLLSGGMDSSAIAAVGVHDLPSARRPRAAYSAVFPDDPKVDESALIDASTADLGLPSVRIAVRGGGLLRGALEHLRAWDLPVIGPNFYFEQPLYARARADGVDVMLDGEGGDELFGERYYLLADLVRRIDLRGMRELVANWPRRGAPLDWQLVWALFRKLGAGGALPYAAHQAIRRLTPATRWTPTFVAAADARTLVGSEDPWGWMRRDGPRWWAHLSYVLSEGVEAVGIYDHLRRRAAMAGIDERHPFLDVDLIEFALAMPPETTLNRYWTRPMLRRAVQGALVDDVRLRPGKNTFDTAFRACLGRDLDTIRPLLAGPVECGDYLDVAAMRRTLLDGAPDRHPRGPRGWGNELWRVVEVETWLRHLADPAATDRVLDEAGLAPLEHDLEVRAA